MTAQEEIETLLGRVASGDPAALRKLYAATSARVYGIALRILRDESLAEEVVEEVFAAVWDGAGKYRATLVSPTIWMVTITRDIAVARLGAARDAGIMAGPLDITDRLYPPKLAREQVAEMHERALALEGCLLELPPGRADMLRHAYLYGATYADLAAEEGVTEPSLRAVLREDLVRLRDCLSR